MKFVFRLEKMIIKAEYVLVKELSLDEKIVSIGFGYDPLLCNYNKIIFLDSSCMVLVCDPRDYY